MLIKVALITISLFCFVSPSSAQAARGIKASCLNVLGSNDNTRLSSSSMLQKSIDERVRDLVRDPLVQIIIQRRIKAELLRRRVYSEVNILDIFTAEKVLFYITALPQAEQTDFVDLFFSSKRDIYSSQNQHKSSNFIKYLLDYNENMHPLAVVADFFLSQKASRTLKQELRKIRFVERDLISFFGQKKPSEIELFRQELIIQILGKAKIPYAPMLEILTTVARLENHLSDSPVYTNTFPGRVDTYIPDNRKLMYKGFMSRLNIRGDFPFMPLIVEKVIRAAGRDQFFADMLNNTIYLITNFYIKGEPTFKVKINKSRAQGLDIVSFNDLRKLINTSEITDLGDLQFQFTKLIQNQFSLIYIISEDYIKRLRTADDKDSVTPNTDLMTQFNKNSEELWILKISGQLDNLFEKLRMTEDEINVTVLNAKNDSAYLRLLLNTEFEIMNLYLSLSPQSIIKFRSKILLEEKRE